VDATLDTAPFSLSCPALPALLDIPIFEGHEELGRPYELTIGVLVSDDDDLDLDTVIGAPATFTLRTGTDERYFHGVIAGAELASAEEHATLYRLVLVPKVWQLSLSVHSRVFVDKTVPEIIEWVLKENRLAPGDDYALRLAGTYAPRPHVSQYRESDLNFISRLMEREGIYYFFESTQDGEKQVLVDRKSDHPELEPAVIPYRPGSTDPTSYAIEAMAQKRRRIPAKVALNDYNKLKPLLNVAGNAPVSPQGAGTVSMYGENFLSPKEGERLARLRAEELASRENTFSGQGRAPLRAGYTFSLEGHPRAAFREPFLATAVRHAGSRQGMQAGGAGQTALHRCEVTAIPARVQFRSERITAIPRIDSVVNAVVDGQADSAYAQIDEHGRYRVRVKYDENDAKAGTASMWVRMSQPHGGDVEGFHFPLRKGTEVLLVFLGGDPDRPIICGVLPNALTPSPVSKSNNTKNVLQTGGLNRLEIEDTTGSEYVKWKTPYANTTLHIGAPHNPTAAIYLGTDEHWHSKIGGDIRMQAGRDIWISADGRLDERITGSTCQHYMADRYEWTKGFLHQEMSAGFKQEETGFYEQYIHGGYKQVIDGFVDTQWSAGAKQSVTGDYAQNVSCNMEQKIHGYFKQTVGEHEMVSNGKVKDLIYGQHEKTALALTSETFIGARNSNMIGVEVKLNASAQFTSSAMSASATLLKMDTTAVGISKTDVSVSKKGVDAQVANLTLKNVTLYLHSGDLSVFK
jgi:type VI secretion system secreted protein VgrG